MGGLLCVFPLYNLARSLFYASLDVSVFWFPFWAGKFLREDLSVCLRGWWPPRMLGAMGEKGVDSVQDVNIFVISQCQYILSTLLSACCPLGPETFCLPSLGEKV